MTDPTDYRPIPDSLRERASYALSFIINFGSRRSPRSFIICSNAPQWVADVINVATNEKGFVDQQRQEFVVDALQRMENGRFVGENIDGGPSGKQLKTWEKSSLDRSRYANFAEGVGSEIQDLAIGYRIERAEVFIQVLDHLTSETYEGERKFSFLEFQQEVRPDGTATA